MAEAATFVTPLSQLVGRYVGRSVPPEQDTSQMSGRRFLCEKSIGLAIVFICCLTLTATTIIKLDRVQEMLFDNSTTVENLLDTILGLAFGQRGGSTKKEVYQRFAEWANATNSSLSEE